MNDKKYFNKIFLDLDGTLLNGKGRHYQCYADILLENGFHPINKDQYWQMKREKIDYQIILHKSSALSIKNIYEEEWKKRIEMRHYLLLDALEPKVLDILTRWNAVKIDVFLVTMRQHTINLHWQLKQLGMFHFFEKILTSESTDMNFDKASLVTPYLNGCTLDKCLWIGDTELDILAAKQLGISVAALHDGMRKKSYLKKFNPKYLCRNLSDLALLLK